MCADDFGMSLAVNTGILDLAARDRLSATSVLVDGPALANEQVAKLKNSGLQIGLHLNFTESFGQQDLCLPLGQLIRAAYLMKLPRQRLTAAVQRQLHKFFELFGRYPDYVDGHQHVHQLPLLRDALIQALRAHTGSKPWLRDTGHPRLAGFGFAIRFKAMLIASLGARGLRRRAQTYGYQQNNGFLGVYDFQGGELAYQNHMRRWLGLCQDMDLLMCHPALGATGSDSLSRQRVAEHAVLSGKLFEHWLLQNNLLVHRPNAASKELS